jgi:hypothetical protein
VKFQPITLATPDPYDTDIQLNYFLSPFANRWPDLVNKIYQKVANLDIKIASSVRADPTANGKAYLDANPDPFAPYQEVFTQLLPGKSLEPLNPRQPREFHYRVGRLGPYPFQTLSSGEQEVVKVAFDLIWKQIRHCVILVDEPELHLHPALTFRLLETIKALGEGTNQLILFSHSPDLISTYHSSGSVYFIDVDQTHGNQAKQLSTIATDHRETARAASANLGLFAVGKKLVFIEGSDASVDRLTYHHIANSSFPEAYLLPMGSVRTLSHLRHVSQELEKAIFGVDLFMIRDRDGLSDEQVRSLESNDRFRVLPRRHIENFFLDADVLAAVASHFYLQPHWHDSAHIESVLSNIAKECVHAAILDEIKNRVRLDGHLRCPNLKSPELMALDDLKRTLIEGLAAESKALSHQYETTAVDQLISATANRLARSLTDGSWKSVFPGKRILARLAADHFHVDVTRLRQAYVTIALAAYPDTFRPIGQIFEHFRQLA